MNKDRGTIKWTSMMLPEHVERLRKWDETLAAEHKKVLSEWELDTLQETIQHAYQVRKSITLTLFHANRMVKRNGYIQKFEVHKKQLLLESEDAIYRIDFTSIQAAELDD